RLDDGKAAPSAETGWVTGCAMLVRSEVFEKVGLLDPDYTIYCEDIDLCLRAARAGWRCRYEPGGRVWHKVSSSSGGGMTPFKLENRIASTMTLMRRFKPLWWRALMLPLHLAGFALMVAGMILVGRPKLAAAALRGARRAARGR
ncbi:MAG TPA: glycosyltransferase family 2 protein, partial [Candidatus Krumholzibacterium sp.]|nr:glycosyltransferase family 2 protein [Candidatus Krumholzibacterium sp.]